MPADPVVFEKLNELLEAIGAHADPRRASAEWKQAFNQLKKTDAEPNRVANVIAMRDANRLAELIDELRAADEPLSESENDDEETPDEKTLQAAMRAFRKRLKLTQLDDESQINSRNPLSKGEGSKIDSIIPPHEFSSAVWRELVRRGKIRHTGKGFYELTHT